MGKILEDGKNVQSLAVIVLDIFIYNFWRRNDINKLFFFSERWLVLRPTVNFQSAHTECGPTLHFTMCVCLFVSFLCTSLSILNGKCIFKILLYHTVQVSHFTVTSNLLSILDCQSLYWKLFRYQCLIISFILIISLKNRICVKPDI